MGLVNRMNNTEMDTQESLKFHGPIIPCKMDGILEFQSFSLKLFQTHKLEYCVHCTAHKCNVNTFQWYAFHRSQTIVVQLGQQPLFFLCNWLIAIWGSSYVIVRVSLMIVITQNSIDSSLHCKWIPIEHVKQGI